LKHHIFKKSTNNNYPIAVLIKNTSFNKKELQDNYITALNQQNIPSDTIIAFTLDYNDTNKAPVKFIKNYLAKLLPALDSLGTKTLYVADSAYFKVLVGKSKAETSFGYVLRCNIKNFEHISVVLGLNHQALIYNPQLNSKLSLSLKTLVDHVTGFYNPPGLDIIHSASYPRDPEAISAALAALHRHPSLTCDIEGFSLRFNEAGVGTIAFAWNEHNGIAFCCDYQDGSFQPNEAIRKLLLEFFVTYKGELTFHHAPYDVKVLIYTLWMQDLLDTRGLLAGLDVMTKRMHDTRIITYLAINSTAGNTLGLKYLAHEFAGNWAVEDIKDIRLIPEDILLKYNLIDALSTHYVRNKYEPIMEKDNQGDLYRGLMLDSLKLIIQLELTGMPMSRSKIQRVKAKLEKIQKVQLDIIQKNIVVHEVNHIIRDRAMVSANMKLKVKQHPIEKFADLSFNPNSSSQLQILLYDQMWLPIIDTTESGAPATGAETIEKLINHTDVSEYKELLTAIIAYGGVGTILSTFIPAFEKAISKDESDTVWLHGSLNLGGTVSGRLSSSNPNLTNLPSGSTYGKLVKSCFKTPTGIIMVGADFNSLEMMIDALTTQDPNKLRVYESGMDSHAFNASVYWPEKMPVIVKAMQAATTPTEYAKAVNRVKKEFPELRQRSKTVSFALQYAGTAHTLVKNSGFSREEANKIYNNYHETYSTSREYSKVKVKQASKDGYVTVAFGLRVRTPLLAQVVYGAPKVPYKAAAEARTTGNSLSQSYGLLNNRAAVAFMKKVWKSKYRYNILPISLIHDACYFLIKDDVEVLEWVNQELITAMQWQDLPELKHDEVKLGANLDVFYKGWHQPITLPNVSTAQEIQKLARETQKIYDDKT